MIIFFLIILVIIAFGAIPPIQLAKRKGAKTILWDYIYPFLGLLIWLCLLWFQVGTTIDIAKILFEPFLIAAIAVIIPWIRLRSFIPNKNFYSDSFILTIFPLLAGIFIRLYLAR